MTEPRAFSDEDSLGDARKWLREQAKDKGAPCPCCTQNVKIYHRGVTASSACDLIRVWHAVGREDFHAPTVLNKGVGGGDFAKLRYWGIVEDLGAIREDGGKAGWWRVTELGEQWVRNTVGVPRYAFIFDGRLLKMDPDGEQDWKIKDALARGKFDYDELMNDPGTMEPPI